MLVCSSTIPKESKLSGLRITPEPHDSKQLRGKHSAYRRADVGEDRIIYRVEGDTLKVAVVGKRNDAEVYKILSGGKS